jgi:hypothetical protein
MREHPIYPEQPSPDDEKPAAIPGSPGHDEWILDEAIEATFPASDPVSAAMPGSSLAGGRRYRSRK